MNFKNIEDKYFEQYYNLYNNALAAEKRGHNSDALKIYLYILNNFRPQGTAYYKHPINLLEVSGNYKEAIGICERAINEIEHKYFNADKTEFLAIKDRLNRKLGILNRLNAEPIQLVLDVVKGCPGVNKKSLYNTLQDKYGLIHDEINRLIRIALKEEQIIRIKKGRAYQHFIND